ncbi:glycosyl hydrolase family 18 protein [Moorena sp. SIO3A2]|uniref:glycosyl hydrolase family 18 protein n=1 Tax=Moorena sp. SIO3A2 TaxID=2607841 RepID=UPI0013B797F3|nr:glycosyl hydrolase family 18 protein [Moorena sp. SIO3A2]NER86825.1 hypothetical protein [Moorena sp. SIO3A2]
MIGVKMKKFLSLLLVIPLTLLSFVPNSLALESPKVVGYIGQIDTYSPPEAALDDILENTGKYNYMIFGFWDFDKDENKYKGTGAAEEWEKGTFGDTRKAVERFHQQGIKVLISAGGEYAQPLPDEDPFEYGYELAKYAKKYNFDGVDFDIENFPNGSPDLTSEWLAIATREVKWEYPEAIISHAPQAPYFSPAQSFGYLEVNEKVGDLIDFYNIQYYNQGSSTPYDTFEQLFIYSGWNQPETSVIEINYNGVPLDKIVIGKPVTKSDVNNTGYVDPDKLGSFIGDAISNGIEPGGVMGWQWLSDKNSGGDWSNIVSEPFDTK